MTTFLARLVERTRGTAPCVEPLLAPRFASMPALEMPNEPEFAVATPALEPAPVPQPKPAPRHRTAAPTESISAARGSVPDATVIPLPAEAQIEVVRETLLVPPSRSTGEEAPARTRESASPRRDALPPVRERESASLVRPAKSPPSRPTDSPHPVRTAVAPQISPNEFPADDRPIVRVTIGRIEVHAARTPAVPPRRTAKESKPQLSLDAYLKSRREGAR